MKLTDRTGDAVEALSRLLQIERRNFAALNEMGVLLASQGHLEPALTAFEAAIEIEPAFTKHTGICTQRSTRPATMKQPRTRHVGPLPVLAETMAGRLDETLILCLWKSREFEEAKRVAEDLISELDPTRLPRSARVVAQALNNYGIILMEMDDPDSAEVLFRRIISLAPAMVDPYVNMAKLNIFRENFQEVIHWLSKP